MLKAFYITYYKTMKKIIFILIAALFLPSLGFACKQISFEDASACIDINRNDSTFSLKTTLSNVSDEISIHCDITLPNSDHVNLWACNGSFTYKNGWIKKIKLYANINNDYAQIDDYYDFDNWKRADEEKDYNVWDPDKIEITTNNDEPERLEWNDLEIKIKDKNWNIVKDFNGNLYYTIDYKKDSNSNREQSPKSYYQIDSSYKYNIWHVDFNYRSDWEKELDEFIRFWEQFMFKITFKSRTYDIEWSKIFYVWWTYSNNNYRTEQFNTKEMQTVKNIYTVWDILISKLKNQNKNLYYSEEWLLRSKDFKDNVYDIIINKDSKKYRDYDDFYKGFMEWFIYTQKLIKQ